MGYVVDMILSFPSLTLSLLGRILSSNKISLVLLRLYPQVCEPVSPPLYELTHCLAGFSRYIDDDEPNTFFLSG